jgi:hypothetical protein
MSKIRVLYYGSCWPTNIGNSFVNLGAIYSLKAALNDRGKVFHFGGMSSYLFSVNARPKNTLPVGDMIKCDYVVIAGMAMCEDNFQTQKVVLQQFIKNGARIIIAGGGASRYDDDEVKKVREWMKKIPIYGFISRDEYSYKNYADHATHSYNGIDSALFISDYFNPPEVSIPDFVITNFDHIPEPRIKTNVRLIIRIHHSCWPTDFRSEYFRYSNTLISDLPSDYLTLYAHTKATYSDRVHACLVTLAYGNKAMFFDKSSPRLRMFRRIGAVGIDEQPVAIDMKQLSEEKESQVKFLRSILV